MEKGALDSNKYLHILPVLFMEYLSISIARTLLPSMLISEFGAYSYFAVGVAETMKGLLAFWSCPFVGRLSDQIGRKPCIILTMIGTTLPISVLIFSSSMMLYLVFVGLSGIFAGTFTLTFAFISDCVDRKARAPAYGLALATFGFSFTIGPLFGSYVADLASNKTVFLISFILVLINLLYIIYKLPETKQKDAFKNEKFLSAAWEQIPGSWNVYEAMKIFRTDKFMYQLALIVLVYYTSVWALVSTLTVYVTRYLHVSRKALGWLLSGYGISTMISESILVRTIVPYLGELNSIRLGLLSFALQCVLIAFSTSIDWVAVSIVFSMFSNLVYPSVSSLVSKVVSEAQQGEALGALNGIRALTEGVGPLFFSLFMSIFEGSVLPGAPYLLAGILSLWALIHTFELVDSELELKKLDAAAEESGRLLETESDSESVNRF